MNHDFSPPAFPRRMLEQAFGHGPALQPGFLHVSVSKWAAALRLKRRGQQPTLPEAAEALVRVQLRQTLHEACASFPPDAAIPSFPPVPPHRLLADARLEGELPALFSWLHGLFPVNEDLTEELLLEGHARVVPESLGFGMTYDTLVEFNDRPEAFYGEVGLAWLFWVPQFVPGEVEIAELEAIWENFNNAHELDVPFPRRFVEEAFSFDWNAWAAELYARRLLPHYTLVSALLNETGNFFFDSEGWEAPESFDITPENLAWLQAEYGEAIAMQKVLDTARENLRADPAVLGELVGTLEACLAPSGGNHVQP